MCRKKGVVATSSPSLQRHDPQKMETMFEERRWEKNGAGLTRRTYSGGTLFRLSGKVTGKEKVSRKQKKKGKEGLKGKI